MEISKLPDRVILQFLSECIPCHEDLSGALLTPDKHLWLASDETTTLERLSFDGSHTFSNHQQIDISKLGVRELCFDGRDLLILAGPSMDLDGPVKLFRLPSGFNASDNLFSWEPKPILDIPYGEGNHHC